MRFVVLVAALAVSAACSAITPGISAYNEGVQHQARGENTLAVQQFKIALQQKPDLAEAHLNIGAIYDQDGLLDAAESETQQAIAIFERTQTTLIAGSTYQEALSLGYTNLGHVEAERANQSMARLDVSESQHLQAAAVANYKKAAALDPNNANAQAVLKAMP